MKANLRQPVKSVEPKLSRSFKYIKLNMKINQCNSIHAPVPTTTGSRSGHGVSVANMGETCLWQGVSVDDLSFIRDRYAVPATLNRVEEKSSSGKWQVDLIFHIW